MSEIPQARHPERSLTVSHYYHVLARQNKCSFPVTDIVNSASVSPGPFKETPTPLVWINVPIVSA